MCTSTSCQICLCKGKFQVTVEVRVTHPKQLYDTWQNLRMNGAVSPCHMPE